MIIVDTHAWIWYSIYKLFVNALTLDPPPWSPPLGEKKERGEKKKSPFSKGDLGG